MADNLSYIIYSGSTSTDILIFPDLPKASLSSSRLFRNPCNKSTFSPFSIICHLYLSRIRVNGAGAGPKISGCDLFCSLRAWVARLNAASRVLTLLNQRILNLSFETYGINCQELSIAMKQGWIQTDWGNSKYVEKFFKNLHLSDTWYQFSKNFTMITDTVQNSPQKIKTLIGKRYPMRWELLSRPKKSWLRGQLLIPLKMHRFWCK